MTPKMKAALDDELRQAVAIPVEQCGRSLPERSNAEAGRILLNVLQKELETREENKRHRLLKRAGFPFTRHSRTTSMTRSRLHQPFSRRA